MAMSAPTRTKLRLLATAGPLLALGIGFLAGRGFLAGAEGAMVADPLARFWAGSHKPDTRVVEVVVDQQSLDFVAEAGMGWPFPRDEVYGRVAKFLSTGGAKAVAFDILFSETSPRGVKDDVAFQESLKKAEIAVLAAELQGGDAARVTGTTENQAWQTLRRRTASARWTLDLPRSMIPVAFERPDILLPHADPPGTPDGVDLGAQALAVASVNNAAVGPGNVFRSILPVVVFPGSERLMPSLPLAMAQIALGTDRVQVISGPTLAVGDRRIPLSPDGAFLLRWYEPYFAPRSNRQIPRYSLAQVLQSSVQAENEEMALPSPFPSLNPKVFYDKLVLVGFEDAKLHDVKATPFSAAHPGVDLNATALSNLLQGHSVRDVPPAWQGLIAALACLAGIALGGLPLNQGQSGCIAVALSLALAAVPFFAYPAGWWLPLVGPELGLLVGYAGGATVQALTEGRERR